MDKMYQGKREDGTWEQFAASSPAEATPEATGYTEVEKITLNSFMDEDEMFNDILGIKE